MDAPRTAQRKSHRAIQRAKKRVECTEGLNEADLRLTENQIPPQPVALTHKRGHRGRRSMTRESARRTELVNKLYNTTNAVSIVLDSYPAEFDRVPTNGAVVRRRLAKSFPRDPSAFRSLPVDIALKASLSLELTKDLAPDHPHHLLIRGTPGEVPPEVGSRLMEAYKRLVACPGLTWPVEKGRNRSDSPAFHLGVWGIVSKTPYITHDTRQSDYVARARMNDFLAIIRDDIAPIIANIVKFYLPNVWVTQQRAYEYVKKNRAHLRDKYDQWDYVDFGGAFFAVAARIGSSSRPHIDFNDYKHSMTWVLAFGEYGGAEFVCPQLGLCVPLAPGQPLGCMTRLLAHYGTEVTYGERLVLTMFTDHFLIGQCIRDSESCL